MTEQHDAYAAQMWYNCPDVLLWIHFTFPDVSAITEQSNKQY